MENKIENNYFGIKTAVKSTKKQKIQSRNINELSFCAQSNALHIRRNFFQNLDYVSYYKNDFEIHAGLQGLEGIELLKLRPVTKIGKITPYIALVGDSWITLTEEEFKNSIPKYKNQYEVENSISELHEQYQLKIFKNSILDVLHGDFFNSAEKANLNQIIEKVDKFKEIKISQNNNVGICSSKKEFLFNLRDKYIETWTDKKLELLANGPISDFEQSTNIMYSDTVRKIISSSIEPKSVIEKNNVPKLSL